MKKTTTVALILLFCKNVFAYNIMPEINKIESQWAEIYYDQSKKEKKFDYQQLLTKINDLEVTYPNAAELKIWKALVISTNAEFENPFSALDSIKKAKNMLENSINKNPTALDGAAHVILGTLYYMTPGWPISFGDEDKAEQLLKKAIEINPNSIDANYFYADFLVSKDKVDQAQVYLTKALKAPIRPEQPFADSQLKKEALIALENTSQVKARAGKDRFNSLISTASNK